MSARGVVAARLADVRGAGSSDAGRNLMARVGALAALTVASLLVARTLGPAGIGALSLLRVLPWLTGVILGGGLYGAAPYFLSGSGRDDPAYRATFPTMAATAGVLGAWLWVLAAPFMHARFFPQMPQVVVVLAGVTVLTQLLETTAKACSQGRGDLAGSNRIIVLEELMFVPLYGSMLIAGVSPYMAIVVSLIGGDVFTASLGWLRLRARGFFAGSRADLRHAWRIVVFGVRAEVGSVVLLLNARLDFAIVGSLVGPTALGVYAVASRYAELLRLPGLALNYVLYPAYARAGPAAAARSAREAVRRMGWISPLAAVPMAMLAPLVLPLAYGPAFRASVVPAWILLAGLGGSGVSGIIAAYLSGDGRPGRTSAALGAGLVVTVAGDLWLIPRHGIIGASFASSTAYLTTTVFLLACFRAVGDRASRSVPPATADLEATRAVKRKEVRL
jgi:O-antigen/teichoic acid export membrane protein